jgi:hypothetical protein
MSRLSFADIISDHLRRYPLMGVQDLYKLGYQAVLGAEHASGNLDFIHQRLMQELGGLTEGPREPLTDPLSPDGRILRIHLRSFIQAGGEPSKLSRAFYEGAQSYKGSLDLMALFWLEARQLAAASEIPFKPKELDLYIADREAGEFQPVHHTIAFRAAYKPAYRVVLKEYWKD